MKRSHLHNAYDHGDKCEDGEAFMPPLRRAIYRDQRKTIEPAMAKATEALNIPSNHNVEAGRSVREVKEYNIDGLNAKKWYTTRSKFRAIQLARGVILLGVRCH